MPRQRVRPLPYPALPLRLPHAGPVPPDKGILQHPLLAAQYLPEHNNQIPATSISFGSELAITWYCAQHDIKFIASPNRRTRVKHPETGECILQTDCPGCLGTQYLDESHPHLGAEFVSCVEQPLRPMCSLTAGSDVRVTWRCEVHGPWQCAVWQRTSDTPRRCPGCVEDDRALRTVAALRPELAARWVRCLTDVDATPENTTVGSGASVLWRCDDCSGEWPATVVSRCSCAHHHCPACTRNATRKLRDLPTLMAQLAPHVDRAWAGELSAASEQRLEWVCHDVDGTVHRWTASVASRAHHRKPSGCPVCTNQVVTSCNSFAALAPEALQRQFDAAANPTGMMDQITARSSLPVWWLCSECGHSWSLAPAHRWDGKSDEISGCQGCMKQVATAGYNLAKEHPAIAACWHPTRNGEITANDVTPGSGAKMWWRCPAHPDDPAHDHEQRVYRRVENRAGCHLCEITQTSLVQEILTCELAWLLGTSASALSDHRLVGWKGKFDVAFMASSGQRVTIDYDSFFHHHGDRKRNRDARKHALSISAGDFAIRLREEGLDAIGENDLHVIRGPQCHSQWKALMNRVVRHLAALFPELLSLDDARIVHYLALPRCVRLSEARDRIARAKRKARRSQSSSTASPNSASPDAR